MTERCKCGHEKSRHELGSGRCGFGTGLSASNAGGLAPCNCQAFRPAEKAQKKS